MLKKNSTASPLYWILPKFTNLHNNQLAQSILIIQTYSITNPKVNSTLRITIQQIIQ